MKTKIEIKSVFGEVLFSYEKEDNTLKDTVEEAVLRGANLGYANLGDANLEDANLEDANLEGANLGGANLGYANLRGANLGYANLGDANLRGANLEDAFLGEFGVINGVEDILIIGPIGSRNGYTTIYHTDKGLFVRCGCFRGTIDEFADKVQETHGSNKHGKSYMALIDFAKTKYNENN